MNPQVTRRLDRVPVPPSTTESARLLARIGASLLGDLCIVWLADGKMLVPVAVHDREPQTVECAMPLLESVRLDRYEILRKVLASGEATAGLVMLDEIREQASRGEMRFLETLKVHSYLIVPLKPSIGIVLFARYKQERSRFYREHVKLGTELADLIAPQLDTTDSLGGLRSLRS